ncbi:hypothetical protein NGF19_03215 [Streptomyces sp. RY43-2]|uniref:Integral membrane protein n=1 Tax=Streptomyces macrolidinus TaxID=2952607 RepID=A0ABT0Z7Q7_9ACTN|nr:hypothetical protein [Streptomyces macrolidinus]MCN9239803.1 hypothetical protein [Streptomyces macrolidinus]
MGWTALYIAFGIVALWLLGEVLLQYKARLRWRLLAFAGFLGVVLGVLIPSVLVIGAGAIAFAIGQTYVTLSFRRGFAAGWAVRNRPTVGGGGSKRRRGGAARKDPAPAPETDEDSFSAPQPPQVKAEAEVEETTVFDPQPLPDDTGSYGVYTNAAHSAGPAPTTPPAPSAPYDGYSSYEQQQQYGYGENAQQYADYYDPYAGAQPYGGQAYDPAQGGDGQQQYGQQAYGQDAFAGGGYAETPPGGVWVPQQRATDGTFNGEPPAEQPYPYQGNGTAQHGNGYDEQYRY